MIWFVSRHEGAREWARGQGLCWQRAVSHLDQAEVAEGDDVYGLVQPHVVARLCARGVRYWHLAIDLPVGRRGCELSAQTMVECRARFVRLHVSEIAT